MVKVKISKKEIEKFLKDEFDCKDIEWDSEGNAFVKMELDQLKPKEKVVEKIITTPTPCITPTMPMPYKPYKSPWSITTTGTSTANAMYTR